jgi:chromosome segregation protein
MTYIKRFVMKGFKSFVKKTEINFTKGINVILGPNGSGKSNISDALCFVLGRLNIKSMRAAKASNLIFLGTKDLAPSKEAIVEIVFDNSNRIFSLDEKEISIKRILKKNGQSLYKINDEKKTRQEVLSLLAQAGIDPNGFNIILQGEIQNFARMHNEERRKVIEEVSGISIYELRKERSLKELGKTEEKLKEVISILKERTSYLNNLEKERQQALKFKRLQKEIEKLKASIVYSNLLNKKKEKEILDENIENHFKKIEKIKKFSKKIEFSINNLNSKIISINNKIQHSTGFEQEKLNQEIADLRAEKAGMIVRIENYEKNINETEKKIQNLSLLIKKSEEILSELKKESPIAKKIKEIEKKKKEIEELEVERKKFYTLKNKLKLLKERILDKKNILQSYINESELVVKNIKILSQDLFDKNSNEEKLGEIKFLLNEKREILEKISREEKRLEKIAYVNENEIEKNEQLKKRISSIDICPLCKSRITKEHLNFIREDVNSKNLILKKEIEKSDKSFIEIEQKRKTLNYDIESLNSEISKREYDLIKISNINDKKEQIKVLQEKIEIVKKEIETDEKEENFLENKFNEISNVEQKYESSKLDIQEISNRNKETIDSEISFKIRELERLKIQIKQFYRDKDTFKEELEEMKKKLNLVEGLLDNKKKKEEELSKKFSELIKERDSYSLNIREFELNHSDNKNKMYNIEQKINDLKIEKAKINAEIENFETEMLDYSNVQIIKGKKEYLSEKLNNFQISIDKIGSVNMRSLEVYDSIKLEYEKINKKAEVIMKEKESILKIIHEIDIKKKKTFIRTLTSLNEIFSKNFSQLSAKGQVFLEIENKKEPFLGGVNIIVKTGHGKYFDVKSLSGGEQTIVALSLIFAIQELKPYSFYILDEIDAPLDKRNAQRLSALLKKYMRKGQYIIVSHNDEVISESTNLYGVSMHEGVSKIISLKIE